MITVTQGDTAPLLTLQLFGDIGRTQPLDLTDAASVHWHILGGAIDRTVAADITDAPNGVTTWQWDGSMGPRQYEVWAVITWNDSAVETAVSYEAMIVKEALG
jgi:hypothetical protein